MGLQRRKPVVHGQRGLVHVELAVDLQLQAVAVLGGPAVAAHQFHALVGVVVFDLVTETAQMLTHQAGQSLAGGRGVTVAHHKVRMHESREIGGVAGGNGRHRMAVHMQAVAVARMRRVDRLLNGGMVWLPAVLNPRLDLCHTQLALVQGHAVVGAAPDEAFAQAHFRQHRRVGGHRRGPTAVQHRHIHFGGVAVRIQVAAREVRFDPGHAQRGREAVELFDMGVLGAAQGPTVAHSAKVVGVVGAAVRRIEHQGCGAGQIGHEGHAAIVTQARQPGHRVNGTLAAFTRTIVRRLHGSV